MSWSSQRFQPVRSPVAGPCPTCVQLAPCPPQDDSEWMVVDAGSVVVHIFQGEEWRREVSHAAGCGFSCQLLGWDGGKGSDARQ